MFGRWRRKTGFFWKAWQSVKRISPYSGVFDDLKDIWGSEEVEEEKTEVQ